MPNSTARAANRRASRRQQAKKTTTVSCQKGLLGLGRNVAHSLLDVSETGIRLMTREALEVGQDVLIGLQSFGQRRPHQSPGTVVWCVAGADGRFCAGVRFEKPLGYGDLQGLAYL